VKLEPRDVFCIVMVTVALVFMSGCAILQPVASAGAGFYTHKRIDDLEEKTQPNRIDALEDRVKDLESQVKALERAAEGR